MSLLEQRQAKSPPSVGELGRVLGLDKSNVTRLCGRLVRADLIALRVSAMDRRVKLVTLTSRGLRMARTIDDASRQQFASVLANLPVGARANVVEALNALVSAVRTTRSAHDD